ncbi:MAG: hypothetical protein HRU20_10360, partial [Pseudomonadales bacterium]|nr:hypothetical protein [Pseudomonadales bacterium]
AGVAGKWKSINGYSFGAAINRAVPEKYTSEMLTLGRDGSSDVMVVGFEWTNADWLWATTVSQSINQVTDDVGTYYDARGWELYSRYNFTPRHHSRVGFNWQKPDDDDYIGAHKIEEFYLSYDYSYNRLNKQDRVYLEFVYNQGRVADGTDSENALLLGLQFNLSN